MTVESVPHPPKITRLEKFGLTVIVFALISAVVARLVPIDPVDIYGWLARPGTEHGRYRSEGPKIKLERMPRIIISTKGGAAVVHPGIVRPPSTDTP
jgi:hypothetical protein